MKLHRGLYEQVINGIIEDNVNKLSDEMLIDKDKIMKGKAVQYWLNI